MLALLLAPGTRAAERIWVDTDAACDGQDRSDVDDCWAIALLARSPGVQIVGISTVFGNASGARTHTATRVLARQLQTGAPIPVWRGADAPVHSGPIRHARAGAASAGTPALQGLRRALAAGRLRLVALGPLTNIAHLLQSHPEAARNITEVLAVMGKREGHVFHPAEGARSRALLGHGPVFTDMNLRLDPHAASSVLRARLPLRLFPYELARQVSLRPEGIAHQGTLAAWLSGRSRHWTDYWRDVIGRDGFYPFDALAAAHVLAPAAFTCAPMHARVAPDTQIGLFGGGPMSLLVGPDREATRQVSYCTRVRTADFDALWSRVR